MSAVAVTFKTAKAAGVAGSREVWRIELDSPTCCIWPETSDAADSLAEAAAELAAAMREAGR